MLVKILFRLVFSLINIYGKDIYLEKNEKQLFFFFFDVYFLPIVFLKKRLKEKVNILKLFYTICRRSLHSRTVFKNLKNQSQCFMTIFRNFKN